MMKIETDETKNLIESQRIISHELSKVAQERDIVCELVVVLDRANDLTTAVLTEAVDGVGRIIQTDEGDPGQARRRPGLGVRQRGRGFGVRY